MVFYFKTAGALRRRVGVPDGQSTIGKAESGKSKKRQTSLSLPHFIGHRAKRHDICVKAKVYE
jgi:hypothetical protein